MKSPLVLGEPYSTCLTNFSRYHNFLISCLVHKVGANKASVVILFHYTSLASRTRMVEKLTFEVGKSHDQS